MFAGLDMEAATNWHHLQGNELGLPQKPKFHWSIGYRKKPQNIWSRVLSKLSQNLWLAAGLCIKGWRAFNLKSQIQEVVKLTHCHCFFFNTAVPFDIAVRQLTINSQPCRERCLKYGIILKRRRMTPRRWHANFVTEKRCLSPPRQTWCTTLNM